MADKLVNDGNGPAVHVGGVLKVRQREGDGWFALTAPPGRMTEGRATEVCVLIVGGRVAATGTHLVAIGDEWVTAREGLERFGYTVTPAPQVAR